MRGETVTIESVESLQYTWGAGIAGGLGGGVCMGVILHVGANIMPFIGALYGWPTVIGGWVAHLVNSVLLGILFTLLVSRPFLREQTTSIGGCIGVGIVYAAAIGLITSGVMIPIAMNTIGIQAFPEPLLPLPGVVGGVLVVLSVGVAHIVYGLVLGATYGAIHNSRRADTLDNH